MKKFLNCLILLFFVGIFSFGEEKIIENNRINENQKKYVVAVDPNLPPFQFLEDEKIVGLNIDLLNRIGRKNGLNLKYVPMGMLKAIEEIEKGNIDIILGTRFNKSFKDKIKYSENILQVRSCIIAKNEKILEIQKKFPNNSFLVGVEYNSSEYNYLKEIKNININVTFNQESLFELLINGKVDFAFGVKESFEYLLMKNEINNFSPISEGYSIPIDYYIGLPFDNTLLLNIINSEIKNIKFKGEYRDLYNKWTRKAEKEKLQKITKSAKISYYIALIFLGTLIAISFFNIQLRKMVRQKTSSLVDMNKLLENKVIELQNNIELNSLICESSPRNIIIFDINKFISFMNKNAILLGNKKIYIGKKINEIPMVKTIVCKSDIEEIIYGEKHQITKEVSVFKRGKKSFYKYNMYPLFDYKKKKLGAFLTIEDITKEVLLKKEAIKKEKDVAITNLVASIAHEIRNPLTSIKAYIEALPHKKNNLKFQNEITKVVPNEFERISKLIDSLIDYSKNKVSNIEKVLFSELIYSSVILVKPMLKKLNIKLKKDLEKDIFLEVDKNQIKQVFINILLNSIQAIEEDKKLKEKKEYIIEIKLYKKNSEVVIELNDNGIGISERELKNIFELFYTTKAKGSGLGLALSKQLIETNKGRLDVKSKKYNFTKFKIIFGGEYL